MKKGVLLLFIILLSSITLAANVDIDIKQVKDSVFKGEQAVFDVVIKNDLGYSEDFKILVFDLNWMETDDSVRSLFVANQKTETGQLKFDPLSDLKPGSYGITAIIKYSGNKIERIIIACCKMKIK